MSNQIYPVLIGQGWPTKRRNYDTIDQKAQSGAEVRLANYIQPYYEWEIPYGYLNDNFNIATADYQILMGFSEQRLGKYDSFLFDDPSDDDTSQYVANPVASPTPSQIGTGDGTTATFQLARSIGGASHLIYNVNSKNRAPRIYFGATLQSSGYSISASGLVTFSSAPSLATVINADFQYYFRCRFDEDSIEAENIGGPYWMVKSVTLYECFQ